MTTSQNVTAPKLKYLDDNVKEGERYTLRYDTRESGGDFGHIVCMDRTESGMRIYDPQNGKVYEDREYRDFIRTHIQYKSTSYGIRIDHPIDVLRVDNLEFKTDVVDQIVTEKQ